MKLFKLCLLTFVISLSITAKGQLFRVELPSFEGSVAVGISSYYGDLVQSNPFFHEPSLSLSAGLSYNLNPNLSFRSNFSYSDVQAHDSKNSRADLKARNLSFKSHISDITTEVEYSPIPINDVRVFSPYIFSGIGFCHFNPYTTDRSGKKVYLQPQGTEGQGLIAYPDRKPYSLWSFQKIVGFGCKYAIKEVVFLEFEIKYHFLNTDFLDDVSNFGYPDKAVLQAKDPALPLLTYRGDELPGGAPYPATTLNRGNPKNKDSFYSAQFKVAFRFKSFSHVEVNY